MSEEPQQEKKTRAKKAPSHLEIGHWGNQSGEFIPCPEQPKMPISDMNSMIQWAKANLGPGEYDLIRKVPGRLQIAVQQNLSVRMA